MKTEKIFLVKAIKKEEFNGFAIEHLGEFYEEISREELTPELEDKIIEEAMKFGEYRGIRISVECAIRDAFKVLKEIRGD